MRGVDLSESSGLDKLNLALSLIDPLLRVEDLSESRLYADRKGKVFCLKYANRTIAVYSSLIRIRQFLLEQILKKA